MKKRIGIGAATAVVALGTWAATALPANASSIEHKDPTVHAMDMARAARSNARPKSSPQLSYHGGAISTDPHVFVVYWGSQWGNESTNSGRVTLSNDQLGVAPYQQAYLQGIVQGASWASSTTQYCQGIATGSTSCPSTAEHVKYPTQNPLRGVWADNTSAAPSQPTQSQLAQEAVRAAAHFGTAFNPATDQVVVSTFSRNNSSGFGTQYCAWHSSTTNSVGQRVAYTNAPYMPDAGASCGANSVSGTLDGVSIVGGHEYAETITDMFPNGGWLDSGGAENADKCAWKNLASVSLATGSYPMQPLWSNSASGCVMN